MLVISNDFFTYLKDYGIQKSVTKSVTKSASKLATVIADGL